MTDHKAVSFKSIPVGTRFRFDYEFNPRFRFSGMKTGLCVKVTNRAYQFVSDGMVCVIGTTKALVVVCNS